MTKKLRTNSLSRKSREGNEITDYVKLDKLPNFLILVEKVEAVVRTSNWWDKYGVDWMIYIAAVVGCFFSYRLFNTNSYLNFGIGIVVYGYCHSVLTVKGAHAAAHGAVTESPKWNKFWSIMFIELMGSFSDELGNEIHIKGHHPHTNIIGLGDSSTWKAPFLPSYIYMFLAPLLVPILTPLVALCELVGKWGKLIRCALVIITGFAINFTFLIHLSGFSILGAVIVTFISRALLSIPYIHVNIFQHIGLAMYSQKNRPKKIYQMSTGVLNLGRNMILDFSFGHSIISCHVEHHLFPRLSDNMCLKIKPLVSKFLKENGLPYHEEAYFDRMVYFVNSYKELMVNAPPITHFVGIQ
ncbi:hypothetical protein LOTGIDRAFT_128818 [Lottia gigantea]|uniref:Fatty acid desaturase domain-containing protein n=1 Tax=Lottia gigantea TaxID=225164 RepID=V3ZQ83_LOTGI|nr:hypothetical protein LOTGIDRAFT_128818 [Lottia gigantea]ESO86492.1 hypothetical protein LOTGIDRAFT_128818 [Lottia gigantea]